jgi:hypothetical protein
MLSDVIDTKWTVELDRRIGQNSDGDGNNVSDISGANSARDSN